MAKFVNGRLAVALCVVFCASVIICASGVRVMDNSPAKAPSVDTLPEHCKYTEPCETFVATLLVFMALPTKKDVVYCQEIIQTTKYCWDKLLDGIEDPNYPTFSKVVHPWGEKVWDKCVSITGAPSPAPTLMIGNSPTQAPAWPEQCRISKSSKETLTQLIITKTFPGKKDVKFCIEIIKTDKDCWDQAMEILEDPNVPALAHLHPWADKAWNECIYVLIANH